MAYLYGCAANANGKEPATGQSLCFETGDGGGGCGMWGPRAVAARGPSGERGGCGWWLVAGGWWLQVLQGVSQ
jgi:hypothetical protein